MTLVNRGEGARVVGPDQPLEKYPLPDQRLDELEDETKPVTEAKRNSTGKEKSVSPHELGSESGA